MNRFTLLAWLALGAATVCVAPAAHAHAASDSYLSLDVRGSVIEGRWDIALRDLDVVLALDADRSGELTWREVRAQEAAIVAYALSRLSLHAAGRACTLGSTTEPLLDRHADGTYVVLPLRGRCAGDAADLAVHYSLLFDVDATHRGLLQLRRGTTSRTAVFASDARTQRVRASDTPVLAGLPGFVRSGVHHILEGVDHVLFVFSLLLPAVVVRRGAGWEPVGSLRPAAVDVARTVTAFTVAHSVTFLLAAYGRIDLPSRLVESAIAASVVVAALNNVITVVESRRWIAAFAFGLVHGLGFASVLGGFDLPDGADRALPLLAFNAGVELGQLAIVAAVLPALYALRHTWFYRRAVLLGGSCVIAAIAAGWFLERAFAWRIPGLS